MKEILLSQGRVALVDDADFERVNKHKWYARRSGKNFERWYAQHRGFVVNGKRTCMTMHLFILGKPPVGFQTDHIDGNGLNNQRSNLRIVTFRQNHQNLHIRKTSQYIGVRIDPRTGRWRAQIKIGGKYKHLGMYKNEIDAANAYLDALPSTEPNDIVIAKIENSRVNQRPHLPLGWDEI